MKQLRTVNKRKIVYKLNKAQSLNRAEIAVLQKERNASFLMFDILENKRVPELLFSLEGMVSLPEFLAATVLSKRLFLHILNQFLRLSRAVNLNRLNRHLVVLQAKYVYFEPQSWNIRFLYLPIQPIDMSGTYRTALKELIQYATFDPNEPLEYVQEYIKLVGSDSTFSLLTLENYVRKHESGPAVESKRRVCTNCGFALDATDLVCPVCGMKQIICATEQSVQKDKQELSCNRPSASDGHAPNHYTVGEYENGGISVFKVEQDLRVPPILLKGSTYNIAVKKMPFRLGKQADIVDFCIRNNAVSRRHAEVTIKEKKYYIKDLNSTNGTFINGRKLPVEYMAELRNNDIIMLGNETFSVLIEED